MNNGLFYGQHACKQTKEGYLLLYNNNMRDSASFPEVLVLQEPASEMDTLKKSMAIQLYQRGYCNKYTKLAHAANGWKCYGTTRPFCICFYVWRL